MSIEEIIRAWKADEQDQQDQHIPENPAGYELSDEELEAVVGGDGDYGNGDYGDGDYNCRYTYSPIIIPSPW